MDKLYAVNTWLDLETRIKLNQKSDFKAILIFIKQIAVYSICLVGAISDYSLFANVIFSIYIGLVIGQFFVIGHDAAHSAFAKNSLLNRIIGRLSFALPLHSYSLWTLSHNIHHHRYTNIKGYDYAWSPKTKCEFINQSLLQQILERIYRSSFGAGIYYFMEIWLCHAILPLSINARKEWTKYILDSIFIFTLLILQPIAIVKLGGLISPNRSSLEILLFGWLIPFLSWNWIMGFATYIQHTHPKIAWFYADGNTDFNRRITHVTTHIIFPSLINRFLLYNIFEHTAHHLAPLIPLYNLHEAQKQCESIYGDHIVTYKWSLKEYLRITSICKLFDFEHNCWTDFDGNPTSEPIHIPFSKIPSTVRSFRS